MTGWAFLILDAIGAIIFQPWTLIALVVAQVVNLVTETHMHRWLPSGLIAVALVWCFLAPLWRQ